MADQKLHKMPEYQSLSAQERNRIVRRVMAVYAAHRHPERNAEVRKVVEQIKSELKAGR